MKSLNDNIVVKIKSSNKSDSGLTIEAEDNNIAEILVVPDFYTKPIPVLPAVGDTVVVRQFAGQKYKEDMLIINIEDVLIICDKQ